MNMSSAYINPPKLDDGIHTSWGQTAEPVPIKKEIQLLMSGNLVRRGEFGPLVGSRALEVELESAELELTFQQALSIRKQLMISKILKVGTAKLKNEQTTKKILWDFEQRQRSLLELSYQYDLPPVTIFRAILAPRVHDAFPQFRCRNRNRPAGRIIQSIINEVDPGQVKSFLSEWEFKELQIAKENDVVGYNGDSTDTAREWEKSIHNYLDKHGIKYVTEETIKMHGYNDKGTPDCLLVDELYINGKQIRWIECKSFYASGLRENSYFTRKAISRQVDRYEKEYGKCGAVMLKYGFSATICQRHPSTLFLDGGPLLHSENEYSL